MPILNGATQIIDFVEVKYFFMENCACKNLYTFLVEVEIASLQFIKVKLVTLVILVKILSSSDWTLITWRKLISYSF